MQFSLPRFLGMILTEKPEATLHPSLSWPSNFATNHSSLLVIAPVIHSNATFRLLRKQLPCVAGSVWWLGWLLLLLLLLLLLHLVP